MAGPLIPAAHNAAESERTGAGAQSGTTRVHVPALLVAVVIMLVGSVYPLLFADAAGKADHGLAMALFWSMSAGLVRGVGYVPRTAVWRWLFSGWACCAGLVIAAWLRWGA